ncbi:MAG: hypothetical protein ACOYBL_01900 [Lachnospiraceae bacterium]
MKKKTKKTKYLSFLIIGIVLAGLLLFVGRREERAVKKVVKAELNQLKNIDTDTVSSYLSYQDLFPESEEESDLSEKIREIFPLFFQDFSYHVTKVSVDGTKATADVSIRVIDASTLAKDYMKAAMQKRIASAANPSSVEYSLEDYYLLLRDILSEQDYDTIKSTCHLTLEKKDGQWILKHTKTSDKQLTGDFAGYLSSSNLFTPEEIVEIHFDTIKGFDLEQLNQYLQLDSLFDMDDTYRRSITQALASQIHDHFDYRIIDSQNNGQTVTVSLEITSCDFKDVLKNYEAELGTYLVTSQALADGTSGRLAVANQLLLKNIEASDASATTTLALELVNDGSSWKLQMTDEVAQAILGNIGSAVAEISNEVPNNNGSDAEAAAE